VPRASGGWDLPGTLFLSEKTVEGHLENVFGKLLVSARVEVADAVGRARG
jgi:DNA-binding NarL/FixJ family response regulator